MNNIFGSNLDDVRLEIMRLEDADYFDADAWSRVLAELSAASRVAGLADAERRMETARQTKPDIDGVIIEYPDVAVETVEA